MCFILTKGQHKYGKFNNKSIWQANILNTGLESHCCAQNDATFLVNTLYLPTLKVKCGQAATSLNTSLTSYLFIYLINLFSCITRYILINYKHILYTKGHLCIFWSIVRMLWCEEECLHPWMSFWVELSFDLMQFPQVSMVKLCWVWMGRQTVKW